MTALLLGAGSSSVDAQTYNFTDLGALSTGASGYSIANGINNAGQIAGTSTFASDFDMTRFATVWSYGTVTNVGTLVPGVNGNNAAYAINASGQLAGFAPFSSCNCGYFGFLWSGSTSITVLANFATTSPAVGEGVANAINASGVAVGYSASGNPDAAGNVSSSPNAAAWASGGVVDLGVLPSFGASYASGINDGGLIVGWSQAVGNCLLPLHRATYWSSYQAAPSDLGSLAGTSGESVANAVNNLGQIVGWTSTVSGDQHAFVSTNGTMMDLGALSGFQYSQANAINASGVIVGTSSNPGDGGASGRALIWQNGVLTDLNSFLRPVDSGAGWVLKSANGINDQGWIVGEAVNSNTGLSHSFQLNVALPPPPSILWRNSSGDVVRWFVSGATITSSPDLGVIPSTWTVQGEADFLGNGNADILWRNTNGDVVIWLMKSGQIASSVDLGVITSDWTIQGTGDFNGDGKSDILWRNSNGDVVIWFMNGATLTSSADFGVITSDWNIQSTGDFNADGDSDILWRNANGDVVIWFMNGATLTSSADLGVITSDWNIQGTGDFNGDGSSDILWRNANGDVVIWFMNGATLTSSADLGVITSDWTIQGSRDLNSDGKSDILWRNSNGDVVTWFMNGGALASSADFGVISSVWTIQP